MDGVQKKYLFAKILFAMELEINVPVTLQFYA